MFRYIKYILSFLFLIIIFLILFKGLQNNNQYSGNNKLNNINKNLSFKTLYNKDFISLETLSKKHKFSVINIWASWCVPCREEHSYLMVLKENKLNIIGLNYKDNINNAKYFLNELGNPYSKILVDNDGTKSIELGAIGVPETYLYETSSFKILKKYIGPLDEKKTKDILKLTIK